MFLTADESIQQLAGLGGISTLANISPQMWNKSRGVAKV